MDYHPGFRPRLPILPIVTLVSIVTISYIIIHSIQNHSDFNSASTAQKNIEDGAHSVLRPVQIRILVVTDATMSAYYKAELKTHVALLFAIAKLAYEHPSLGQSGKIKLQQVGLISLDENSSKEMEKGSEVSLRVPPVEDNFDIVSTLNSNILLRNFCAWQRELYERINMDDYQATVYLTRKNMFYDKTTTNDNESTNASQEFDPVDNVNVSVNPTPSEVNNPPPINQIVNVLGISYKGTICSESHNCAIVQDRGLDSSAVVAHEVGHLLNLDDDHDDFCQDLKAKGVIDIPHEEEASFIMSSVDGNAPNDSPFKWSECSKMSLENFIKDNSSYCIHSPQTLGIDQKEDSSEGRPDYDEDDVQEAPLHEDDGSDPDSQCKRWLQNYRPTINGTLQEASACPGRLNCNRLSCRQSDKRGCITSMNFWWRDKTPCGESSWCIKGVCVTNRTSN